MAKVEKTVSERLVEARRRNIESMFIMATEYHKRKLEKEKSDSVDFGAWLDKQTFIGIYCRTSGVRENVAESYYKVLLNAGDFEEQLGTPTRFRPTQRNDVIPKPPS